jgi:hypothetical protein
MTLIPKVKRLSASDGFKHAKEQPGKKTTYTTLET